MSIWNWFHESVEEILDGGDAELQEMADATMDSFSPRYAEIERRLSDNARARAIAVRRGLHWWVGFLDHWRLQTLLHESHDYKTGLDLAVRATIDARKPACAGLPQRVCLHEDLISVYATVDPDGYETEVRDALGYMEREAAEGAECRQCILGLAADFEMDLGNFQAALEKNNEAGARAAQSGVPHHLSYAYSRMCRLFHRLGQIDDDFLGWAQAGADTARASNNEPQVAVCELWKAVALRKLGRDDEAKRAYAASQLARKGVAAIPSETYFDALAGYHMAGRDLVAALTIRNDEAAALENTGRTFQIAENHLHRCGLRAALGTLSQDDVDAASVAIHALKKPDRLLVALNSMLSDDTNPTD